MAERDDKRRLILEAAAEVFKEKDYHEATVEEIAKRAQVGKGTIYQYFPGKQSIKDEIYNYGKDCYVEKVQELLAMHASLREIMYELIAYHIDNVQSSSMFAKSLFADNTIQNTDLEQIKQDISVVCEDIYHKGIAAGEIKTVDLAVFSSYLVGVMMSALAYMTFMWQEGEDTEKIKQQFAELILQGILR